MFEVARARISQERGRLKARYLWCRAFATAGLVIPGIGRRSRRMVAAACLYWHCPPSLQSPSMLSIEIERKFLVRGEGWRQAWAGEAAQHLRQGYLTRGDVTVRVRIRGDGDSASLTIKGRRRQTSRLEFELPIPVTEAEELLRRLAPRSQIEKVRHSVYHHGHLWNVDEFKGAHAGLVLAEIELTCPSEQFDLPDWIGSEVTGDERYSNSVLAETGGPLARLSRPSMLAEG